MARLVVFTGRDVLLLLGVAFMFGAFAALLFLWVRNPGTPPPVPLVAADVAKRLCAQNGGAAGFSPPARVGGVFVFHCANGQNFTLSDSAVSRQIAPRKAAVKTT